MSTSDEYALALETIEQLLQQQQIDQARIELSQRAGKVGTFEWDVKTNIATWTKEFESLYGDHTGKNQRGNLARWLKYIHPADLERVQQETDNSLKQKRTSEFEIEFRVIWPDHSIHYLTTRASIIRDKRGTPLRVVGVNIDLTDRKLIENNLSFLSQVSTVLASSLDYKTTLSNIAKIAVPEIADWCAVDIKENDQIERLAVAHVDPQKVKWAEEIHTKFPPKPDAPTGVAKVIRTGQMEYYPHLTQELLAAFPATAEERKILKILDLVSVMIIPIRVDGQTIGAISFVTAESRRQYTAADLVMAHEVAHRASVAVQNAKLYQKAQENENKFKAFVDSNIVGVFTANKEGFISDANDGYLRIIGYTQDDLKSGGLNRWKLTAPEYKSVDEHALDELYSTGKTTPWEKEYIKKDGSQVPVIVASTLINNENFENITIVLDITERKRLEQRKDEFIGIASHELKTPLTSIKGYVQILERIIMQMTDERLKTYVSKTNTYIDRLNSLISDLLDVSKIQAGKLQLDYSTFNFDELINASVEAIQPTSFNHNIIVTGSSNTQVTGDKHRLEQVITNLLTNAVKYSPNADKIEVTVSKKGKELTVAVKDYGIGIPKKEIDKLFQRFYRVQTAAKSFSGLGIGLYISSEIIQRHRGKLWVESEEGKGSTFYFSLPLAKGKKSV